MSELLDYALLYASKGWCVFPLKEMGKEPLTMNGVKNASNDTNQIKEWWSKYPNANIGLAMGAVSGIMAIDIDIDEDTDKNGFESLRDWEIENGCFPDTWRTITGKGGSHLLFKTKGKVSNRVNIIAGVDVRGDGGYIVAPPSIHPNGNAYEWEYFEGDCELSEIDETVEFFLNFRESQGQAKFEIPEEVTKGGRNDMLFRLACSLQSKGLGDSAIEVAVKEENQSKCKPPLADREIKQILGSVKRLPKGNSVGGTYAEPKQKEENKEAKQRVKRKLKRASELMDKDLPEPKVIVGIGEEIPLLVEGTCILSAKPKLGKSWLVLAMCLAISRGEDFLGYKTRKCSTLYLDLETSEQLQQKRIRKVLNGSEIPNNFYLDTQTDSLDNGFIDQIEDYMKQDPDIGVIVIDVFQIIRSASKGVKENEYEHAYRDITPLNEIAKKHNISIILVCHDRKMVDLDDPFANILGSTGLQGAVAQMMVMFKPRKDLPIHLSVKGKTIDGIIDLDIELNNAQWKTTSAQQTEAQALEDEYYNNDIRTAVLALAENGGYKGRCTGIIEEAAKLGVGVTAGAKELGGFISKHIGHFLKEDNILVEKIDNGSASKIYRISKSTIHTIHGFVHTEDANPWE